MAKGIAVINELMPRGKVGPKTGSTKKRLRALLSDPMLRMSRLIGVFSVTEELKASKKATVLGLIIFMALQWISDREPVQNVAVLLTYVYQINWCLAIFTPTRHLRQALREFSDILDKLELDYSTSWWLFTAFVFLMAKFVLNAVNIGHPMQWLYEFGNTVLAAPNLLLPLQYATMTRHCAKAFTALHKKLPTSDDDELQRLAAIHCRLCNLSKTINQHYGFPILVTTCLIIAFSMSFTYLFVLSTQLTALDYVRIALKMCYIVVACVNTVYAAYRTAAEADQFNKTIKKILISRNTINEEYLKLYIKMGVRVNPTAYGFFKLRPGIFTAIFAGLISYAVVLLQFAGKSTIPIIL